MNVLVTGSKGTLGVEICSQLGRHKIKFFKYSHFMNLDDIKWENFTHIVNCAAVIPNVNETLNTYWQGNVYFLSELITHSKNKHFIHFSSLSEQYKFEDYQVTKLIGSNLLSCNSHLFSSLQIIPIPTLEDNSLINAIVEKSKTEKVIVDRLKYSFIEIDTLARLIVESIESKTKANVIKSYVQKDLYEEVRLKTNSENVIQGDLKDHTSVNNNLITFSSSLLSNVSKY